MRRRKFTGDRIFSPVALLVRVNDLEQLLVHLGLGARSSKSVPV